MFRIAISDSLKEKIRKLKNKNPKFVNTIYKKVNEIVDNDEFSINRYKRLKYNLKGYQRVKIEKHFVLIFYVNLEKKIIVFEDFDHHDRIYRK
jgi:mRNA-degrading endonuclease RelE of RelBE toxin-antitoxin system